MGRQLARGSFGCSSSRAPGVAAQCGDTSQHLGALHKRTAMPGFSTARACAIVV